MRRLIVAAAIVLSAFCLTNPPALDAQPNVDFDPELIQVLIVTGQNVHPWRETTPLMKEILEETGKFEVRVTEEFRGAGPETLVPYDAVIVNYYDRGSRPDLRWGERADRAFEEFVSSGGGLILYHLTLGAFDGWTEFEQMSGGNWRPDNGHHAARHDFTVDVRDSEHPITRGLLSPFLAVNDELYANLRWQPEGSYHVLATAWDDHSLYNGRARQPTPGDGIDQPILWTTDYGEGRVFVTALGHDGESVDGLGFRVTFARGVEWAATGDVTQPIPPEMAAP
jgi:hypothetical protein